MKKIHDFSRRSPILFSAAFTLLVVLVHVIFVNLLYLLPDSIVRDIFHQLVFMAWPTALVLIFGFGFIFRQRGFRATFRAALLLYLLFTCTLLGQMYKIVSNPATEWKSGAEIFVGVLMLIGVGFREEVLFRGVVTNAIARKYANSTKGIWITVLSAAAMFGAMHMGNLFNGVHFQGALIQSLSSFGLGACLCAVYLRGGNIWGLALLHSLMDASGAAAVLFTNAGTLSDTINDVSVVHLIFIVTDLLFAAFLLRKSKRQRIFDRIQQMYAEVDA